MIIIIILIIDHCFINICIHHHDHRIVVLLFKENNVSDLKVQINILDLD